MLAKVMTGPVLWLPLTLGVYLMSSGLYRRAGKIPLLNPTLLTIAAICSALIGLGVPYPIYFQSVSILHYLLGTAVVALAIPMHRNLRKLTGQLRRITVALVAGSLTSIIGGLLIAKALKASDPILLSIAPKSATAAVSMEIARGIGGLPAVTASLTIVTGIIGAVCGPYILSWARIESPSARGIALGTVSHGIATARAFSESEFAGCCASLAMGLNAILTAIFVPVVLGAMRLIGI